MCFEHILCVHVERMWWCTRVRWAALCRCLCRMFRQICCRLCVVMQITPTKCVLKIRLCRQRPRNTKKGAGRYILLKKRHSYATAPKKIQHECLDYICVCKCNRQNLSGCIINPKPMGLHVFTQNLTYYTPQADPCQTF